MKSILISHPYSTRRSLVKAEGKYYIDDKGRKILDLESGIWCASLGHNLPEIKEIVNKQFNSLTHVAKKLLPDSINIVGEKLLEIADMNGKCFFLNTGSEAIEFAINLAKIKIPNSRLIGFKNNYVTAYGQATKPEDTIDITPCFKCTKSCTPVCSVLNNKIQTNDIFIFDPFCFSRQIFIPPTKLIHVLVNEIKTKNGLLIVDEITTGMGRCGKWFAYQYFDIKPDFVVLGKSLGNGYPVSAIIFDQKIVKSVEKQNFMYYQSHQNDPLGYQIAHKVIELIEAFNYISQVEKKGAFFLNLLKNELCDFQSIIDIRGIGLMIGIQIDKSINVEDIFAKLLRRNIFIGTSIKYNMLNIFPPYSISKEELKLSCETIKDCLLS